MAGKEGGVFAALALQSPLDKPPHLLATPPRATYGLAKQPCMRERKEKRWYGGQK